MKVVVASSLRVGNGSYIQTRGADPIYLNQVGIDRCGGECDRAQTRSNWLRRLVNETQ